MSTVFRLTITPADADIKLVHNLLAPDTWEDVAVSPNLVVNSGNVSAGAGMEVVLNSGSMENVAVLRLTGFTFAAKAGDTGSATCELCTGTTRDQTWKVASVT